MRRRGTGGRPLAPGGTAGEGRVGRLFGRRRAGRCRPVATARITASPAGGAEADESAEAVTERLLDGETPDEQCTDATEEPGEGGSDARRLLLLAGEDDERLVGGGVDVHLAALLGVGGADDLHGTRVLEVREVVLGVLERGVDPVREFGGRGGLGVELREEPSGRLRRERGHQRVGVLAVDADDPWPGVGDELGLGGQETHRLRISIRLPYVLCGARDGRGNAFSQDGRGVSMASVDPVLVAIITGILLFVLAVYLMLRRTLLAFSEGMRDSRRRD